MVPASPPDRGPLVTPEVEFRRRLEERHPPNGGPPLDPEWIVRCVKAKLEEANVSLDEFLKFELPKTANPRAVRNPGGHYVKLAQRLVIESLTRSTEALRVGRTVLDDIRNGAVDPGPVQRCAKCGGGGYLTESTFCNCKMGADVAVVEQRKRKRAEQTQYPVPGPANSPAVQVAA